MDYTALMSTLESRVQNSRKNFAKPGGRRFETRSIHFPEAPHRFKALRSSAAGKSQPRFSREEMREEKKQKSRDEVAPRSGRWRSATRGSLQTEGGASFCFNASAVLRQTDRRVSISFEESCKTALTGWDQRPIGRSAVIRAFPGNPGAQRCLHTLCIFGLANRD
ncbi:hypothetical protein KM043_002100 [Ampulex compressa]|nr:hypothetical protein KM043_002100 [Ampulex compressa]